MVEASQQGGTKRKTDAWSPVDGGENSGVQNHTRKVRMEKTVGDGERHNTSRGTNQGSVNQRQRSRISTEEDRAEK